MPGTLKIYRSSAYLGNTASPTISKECMHVLEGLRSTFFESDRRDGYLANNHPSSDRFGSHRKTNFRHRTINHTPLRWPNSAQNFNSNQKMCIAASCRHLVYIIATISSPTNDVSRTPRASRAKPLMLIKSFKTPPSNRCLSRVFCFILDLFTNRILPTLGLFLQNGGAATHERKHPENT